MKLTGNTILVTGGGSGIGQGLARAFHDLGNIVIVAGRRASLLNETIGEREGMHAIVLDVADADSVEECVEVLEQDFPQLNMLIHSAGMMTMTELGSGGSLETAEQIVNTNLLGTMRIAEGLIPQLSGRQGAAICTVSSGLAFVPLAAAPSYSASKAGVHSYTVSLRERLRGEIDVIEIIPPAVNTRPVPGEEMPSSFMTVEDYVAETMAIFGQEPTPEENVVVNARRYRDVEKEGRVREMLDWMAGR